MKTETKISVWIDRTSEAGKASVIVSKDTDDSSDTIKVFAPDEMGAAKTFARKEAARRGIEAVIESPDRSGNWVAL